MYKSTCSLLIVFFPAMIVVCRGKGLDGWLCVGRNKEDNDALFSHDKYADMSSDKFIIPACRYVNVRIKNISASGLPGVVYTQAVARRTQAKQRTCDGQVRTDNRKLST